LLLLRIQRYFSVTCYVRKVYCYSIIKFVYHLFCHFFAYEMFPATLHSKYLLLPSLPNNWCNPVYQIFVVPSLPKNWCNPVNHIFVESCLLNICCYLVYSILIVTLYSRHLLLLSTSDMCCYLVFQICVVTLYFRYVLLPCISDMYCYLVY
jgi:hypothetical protein